MWHSCVRIRVKLYQHNRWHRCQAQLQLQLHLQPIACNRAHFRSYNATRAMYPLLGGSTLSSMSNDRSPCHKIVACRSFSMYSGHSTTGYIHCWKQTVIGYAKDIELHQQHKPVAPPAIYDSPLCSGWCLSHTYVWQAQPRSKMAGTLIARTTTQQRSDNWHHGLIGASPK